MDTLDWFAFLPSLCKIASYIWSKDAVFRDMPMLHELFSSFVGVTILSIYIIPWNSNNSWNEGTDTVLPGEGCRNSMNWLSVRPRLACLQTRPTLLFSTSVLRAVTTPWPLIFDVRVRGWAMMSDRRAIVAGHPSSMPQFVGSDSVELVRVLLQVRRLALCRLIIIYFENRSVTISCILALPYAKLPALFSHYPSEFNMHIYCAESTH